MIPRDIPDHPRRQMASMRSGESRHYPRPTRREPRATAARPPPERQPDSWRHIHPDCGKECSRSCYPDRCRRNVVRLVSSVERLRCGGYLLRGSLQPVCCIQVKRDFRPFQGSAYPVGTRPESAPNASWNCCAIRAGRAVQGRESRLTANILQARLVLILVDLSIGVPTLQPLFRCLSAGRVRS